MKKIKKHEIGFLYYVYSNKNSGTTWACKFTDDMPQKLCEKFFPDYITSDNRFDFGQVTGMEYPEVYIKFLEKELDRMTDDYCSLVDSMKIIVDRL